MASDQWNGFHHAPHPDEDDDWYYDQESDYLADQPPPPPPPPKQSNMLQYQPYAQPAPQPKVRVDLSRVSYSTWQNPWQSSLKYQNQQRSQQGARPVYGYSAWDYQDEDQDEEYASSGMEDVVEVDSFHADPHIIDQDEVPAAPEPAGPSQAPPPPPAPAPPPDDVVVVPPPIAIHTGQLPPGITVPSSPSSGKSVHFPEGLEDPKGTSIRNGKKVLNRKASLSNLKEPPKPIIPLVQKREHKGLTWKEQQEKRRQDQEKRREAARQRFLKLMEAAKKKKELDLQQKKEAAEKAKKKKEEDAEKAKKKAEEDAIKAKKKAEEAKKKAEETKKKKELEAEKAKKKAEEAKKKKELEAKKKEDAKKKAEEAKKKLAAKKSALKKPKTKDATSGGGDGEVPPPAPDPPSAPEEVTKSVLPSDALDDVESSSPDFSACHDADPSADERIDASETSLDQETKAQLPADIADPSDSKGGQSEGEDQRHESVGEGQPTGDGLEDEILADVVEGENSGGVSVEHVVVEAESKDASMEEAAQPNVEVPDDGPKVDDPSTESPSPLDDARPAADEEIQTSNDNAEPKTLSNSPSETSVDESSQDLHDQETNNGSIQREEFKDLPSTGDEAAGEVPSNHEIPPPTSENLVQDDGGTDERLYISKDHETSVDVQSAPEETPNQCDGTNTTEMSQKESSDSTEEPDHGTTRNDAPPLLEHTEHVEHQPAQNLDMSENSSSGESIPELKDNQEGGGSFSPQQDVDHLSSDDKDSIAQSEERGDGGVPPPDPSIDDQNHSEEDPLSPQEKAEEHLPDESGGSEQSSQDVNESLAPPTPEIPAGDTMQQESSQVLEKIGSEEKSQIDHSAQEENDDPAPLREDFEPSSNEADLTVESEQNEDDGASASDGAGQPVDKGSSEAKTPLIDEDQASQLEESEHDEVVPPAAPDVPLLDDERVQVDEAGTEENSGHTSIEEISQDLLNATEDKAGQGKDEEVQTTDGAKQVDAAPNEEHDTLATPQDAENESQEDHGISQGLISAEHDQAALKDENVVDEHEENQEEAPEPRTFEDVEDVTEPDAGHAHDATHDTEEGHETAQDSAVAEPSGKQPDNASTADNTGQEHGESQESAAKTVKAEVDADNSESPNNQSSDEKIQETSSNPAAVDEADHGEAETGDDGEQSLSAPDTTQVNSNPPAEPVESTAEGAESSNSSQKLDEPGSVDDCSSEADSSEKPVETAEVASTDHDHPREKIDDAATDSTAAVETVDSENSKAAVDEDAQDQDQDGGVDENKVIIESNDASADDTSPHKDDCSQQASGDTGTPPQAAATEDDEAAQDSQPPAAETSESQENVKYSSSGDSKDNTEQTPEPEDNQAKETPENESKSPNTEPERDNSAASPPVDAGSSNSDELKDIAEQNPRSDDSQAKCKPGNESTPPNADPEQDDSAASPPTDDHDNKKVSQTADSKEEDTSPAEDQQQDAAPSEEKNEKSDSEKHPAESDKEPQKDAQPTAPDPASESQEDDSSPSPEQQENTSPPEKSAETPDAKDPVSESTKEPETSQERQKDAQPAVSESAIEPQEETTSVAEKPEYAEADYKVVEAIMNPPPPPEPEPEIQKQDEGKLVAEQSKSETSVQEDDNAGEGQEDSQPADDGAVSGDTGEKAGESVDEDAGQSDATKGEDSDQCDSSEDAESAEGHESDAKPGETVPATQDVSTESTPKPANPSNEETINPQSETQPQTADDSPLENAASAGADTKIEIPEGDTQTLDTTSEKIDAETQNSADDPASSEKADNQNENQTKVDVDPSQDSKTGIEDTSASLQDLESDLPDSNASDLGDTDDALSVASSMAAAVGGEEDSASEAGGDDPGIDGEESQPSKSSGDSPPNDDQAETAIEAAPEPAASNQDPSESKLGDEMVDSAAKDDSTEGKPTSADGESIETKISVPESAVQETDSQAPSVEKEDEKAVDVDSHNVEHQEAAHEGETSVAQDKSNETPNDDSPVTEQTQKEPGSSGQAVVQDTNEEPPTGKTLSTLDNQESSDPAPEGDTEKTSPEVTKEDESLSESNLKGNESLDQDGNEETAITEQSADDGTAEKDSGKDAPAAIEQVTSDDIPLDREAVSAETGEPETEEPTSIPKDGVEESPAIAEATPKDDAPKDQSAPSEEHIPANEFPGNEVSSADEKDVEQLTTSEAKEASSQEPSAAAENDQVTPIVEQPEISETKEIAPEVEQQPESETLQIKDTAPEAVTVENPPDTQANDPSNDDVTPADESAPEPPVENPPPEISTKDEPELVPAIRNAQVQAHVDGNEPEASSEQHHSEASAREAPPAESIPERVDNLPASPTDTNKERKHRRSSVSHHDYPYRRRHSTTSTGKGSQSMSSSSRDQAAVAPADVHRRSTVDKSFRRVSIPSSEGKKFEEERQRKRERRRSHTLAKMDEEEEGQRRRRERRDREAAEVEEARLKAEQAAAELKMKELAHAEREHAERERREAKKAAMREKRRLEEEAMRREEERRLREEEERQRLENEKRRRRAEREAQKAKEAEELKRHEMEELEREEARKQRKRERRHRERERRVSMAEGDGYPPFIPPISPQDEDKSTPPKPRRRRTEDIKAPDPAPRRQSLMGGLFGLGRSNTEPTVPKTVKEPRRPSNVHRSSSHRKHQRTPSEERRHQERKAERRASKATASFDDSPALHDPIPEDDIAPEQVHPPSSPVQEEPAPVEEELKPEVERPPPIPRATTFANYGQTERDVEPGSSHGGGSSDRRKHHRRRHEHGEGERDRRHHHRRRNSAALDEFVGEKIDRGDQDRDKTKHRSKVHSGESKRRDSIMEGKHRSSGSGRTREKERERERERERQKKGTSSGGGLFGSLKKLVK